MPLHLIGVNLGYCSPLFLSLQFAWIKAHEPSQVDFSLDEFMASSLLLLSWTSAALLVVWVLLKATATITRLTMLLSFSAALLNALHR
jgi:hypothetical protein